MELNLADVLARVGKLSGVDTDAEIARALGVSPQTLSTWKRRGTIPYERVCDFAVSHDVSLDYLLLGIGGSSYVGGVDPVLLEGIGFEFQDSAPELQCAYNMALVYNRISPLIEPGKNWADIVRREVAYLSQILRMQKANPAVVHEEESRVMKKVGISDNADLDLSNPSPRNSSSDGSMSVNQKITGSQNQVAGRNIFNKKKS